MIRLSFRFLFACVAASLHGLHFVAKHISIQFIDFRRSSNTDGLFTDFREILKHGFLKFEWSINLKSIPKNLAKTLRASVIVKFSPRTSSTCGSCSILFATRSNAFKIIALWSKANVSLPTDCPETRSKIISTSPLDKKIWFAFLSNENQRT